LAAARVVIAAVAEVKLVIAGCRYNVRGSFCGLLVEWRIIPIASWNTEFLILAILQFDEMSGSFAWEIICSHHSNYGLWLFISDDHRG